MTKVLALDAIGVLHSAADDVEELLAPYLREHRCRNLGHPLEWARLVGAGVSLSSVASQLRSMSRASAEGVPGSGR